jgi:phosphoglycerol transferase MdoB-like AlkP superfamily enzyme
MWWLIAAAYLSAIVALLRRTEQSVRDFGYAAAFSATIFCLLLLLFQRPAVAGLGTFLIVLGLIRLSLIKFDRTGSNLHAYDLFYFLPNPIALGFWVRTDHRMAMALVVASAALIVVPAVVGLIEPPSAGRMFAAALFLLALTSFGIARLFLAPWHYWEPFGRSVHVARFIATIFEALSVGKSRGTLRTARGNSLRIATARPAAAFPGPRPTIILILSESTFPPWIYTGGSPDPAFEDFFRSDDGRIHGLRAEAFGGPTWATEFSILTGIPSASYGSFATHVFQWAQGKIHHSLPLYLKAQGYSTGLMIPTAKEFIKSDRFYSSIGFDEIRDQKALGASSDRESDAFYFDKSIDWLKEHFSNKQEPLFLYVLTSANHYPHSRALIEQDGSLILEKTYAPDREMDEYLIRLRRSCRDYGLLRKRLAENFPKRAFLIVHFGDHQPYFTRHPGKDDWRGWPRDYLPKQEIAYQTYFAVHGVNFVPNLPAAIPETVEASYLSTVLLSAARMPLDEIFEIRQNLMGFMAGSFSSRILPGVLGRSPRS